MIREVITYPHKLLRTKSEDVVNFDEKLHTLLDDMYDTMLSEAGVGLAAIQVAVPLNILIISLPNDEDVQNKFHAIKQNFLCHRSFNFCVDCVDRFSS